MVDMMMQAGVNPWAEVERQARRAYKAEQERDELRARLGEPVTSIEVGTVEWVTSASPDRHPSVNQVLRHFAFAHLPEKLQPISKNCANLALQMCAMIPDDPELVVGLRKLLEAKDCFVRAAIDKE